MARAPGLDGRAPSRLPSWRSDGTGADPGALGVGHDRAGAGAGEPGYVRHPVLGILPEGPEGPRDDVAEVPRARGDVRPDRRRLPAERPERVEVRAGRLDGAAGPRGGVAQRFGRAHVGLELDLRVQLAVGQERPRVVKGRWMVPAAVRPGEGLVAGAVEVEVTVLEPPGQAEVGRRELRHRRAVDGGGAGALLEARAVGE